MQLDKTRIAIRERNYFDLLDLALVVIRAHAVPLLLTTVIGAAPLVAFNAWLLSDWFPDSYLDGFGGAAWGYFWVLALLVTLELPLAGALTTLYLGQALFEERPSVKRLAIDFWRSLPQLIVCQVILRGMLTMLVVTIFLLYTVWPYLSEVILLERNPLWSKKRTGMSTVGRSAVLHSRNTADLFGRWVMSVMIGAAWIAALWAFAWYARKLLSNQQSLDTWLFTFYLQLAVWFVAGYFTVVRFLGYLDLRIRNEGWEIELRMRAEASRLTRQVV